MDVCCLDQREVCTRQDSLCLLQSIHFACASLLTGVKILQQPVTVKVDVLESLHGVHVLHHFSLVLLLELQKAGFAISLGSFLVRQGLGIAGPLVCGFLDHALVLSLVIISLNSISWISFS